MGAVRAAKLSLAARTFPAQSVDSGRPLGAKAVIPDGAANELNETFENLIPTNEVQREGIVRPIFRVVFGCGSFRP